MREKKETTTTSNTEEPKKRTRKPRAKKEETAPKTETVTVEEIKELHAARSDEDWEKEKPAITYNTEGLDAIQEKVEDGIENDMTPSEYFAMLKEMKGVLTTEFLDRFISTAMDTMETLTITGQKSLAKTLAIRLQLALKEHNAVLNGYNQVINRTDLEVWVYDIHTKSTKKNSKVSPIHVIEMERYQRPIPKEVIKKLRDAKKYFERFYIVFTDYTGESERIVKKENRDKDPVLFGTFMVKTSGGNVRPGEHLFFIADWVDEYCDLTFEQILSEYSKKTKKDMQIPYEKLANASAEELEEYFTKASDEAVD